MARIRYLHDLRSQRPPWASTMRQPANSLTYSVATTREDVETALRLVHDRYVATGMTAPHPSGMRISAYHRAPTTKIIAVKDGARVVGTMAMVLDSPAGLPVDAVAKAELDALRSRGAVLMEGSGIGVADGYKGLPVMMGMFKMLFGYARARQVTDIVCGAMPHHVAFYRRKILFRSLGKMRPYPGLSVLVQAHILNLYETELIAEIENPELYSWAVDYSLIRDYPDLPFPL